MSSAWYIAPFALSFAAFCFAKGLLIYWYIKPKRLKKKNVFAVTRNTGRHLMCFSLILLASVWLFRFSIGNWCLEHPDPSGIISSISIGRQVFNSFLHGLQTFSMDEEYTAYMENGILMMADIFGGHCGWLYVLYISALNIISPIAGGAFVFEILAGIFPQLRYIVSKACWYKNRFYFTALNEQSLALAKSILADPTYKHVLLIFTDVYSDDENEESSEMLLSAKALGAICLKDDLLHISLCKIGKSRTYIFLSDREETENLQTLSQLLDSGKQKELKNTEISVFGTDKRTSNIEDEVIYIHNRLSAEYEDKGLTMIPDIAPVNGIRHMSQKLFYDLPLFECLYGKTDSDQQINLTIIGSGVIGTEMFLNAYWFGQMVGVTLNITIVSASETEQEFIDRIDGINPDIMASSKAGNEILNVNIGEENDKSERTVAQPVYFHFRYEKKNIAKCDLQSFLNNPMKDYDFRLRDTDYFIVAAGSDEENYLIADKLRQSVGYYHLNKATEKKTIISYVIYNSNLCNSLNVKSRQKYVRSPIANEFDVYMHAFGSMEEIFCVENILRKEIKSKAEIIREKYNAQQQIRNKESIVANQLKTRKYYNGRADDARRLHIRYKVFSAGLLKPALFSTSDNNQYVDFMIQKEKEFADKVINEWTNPQYPEDNDKKNTIWMSFPEYAGQANALAWMEHRRWNAFMRICGFRKPDDINKYIDLDSDVHCLAPDHDKAYQFLSIKLHPCIVECDLSGYPGINSKKTEMKPEGYKEVGPDELDLLFKSLGTDYKVYDYPNTDAAKCKNNSEV